MKLLEGKVVLVTGGARGQGRAHALVSARHGADIVLVDLAKQLDTVSYPMARPEDLKETAAAVEALSQRALAIEADVRDRTQMTEAVQRTIAQFGRIDALIANAGIWTIAPFWELTDQQWEETISVNLTGVWQSVRAVAPHMIERQSGSIVVTSSSNGIRPAYNYAHYIASKFGVTGLMQAMALELRPYGVRCNAVHPGGTRTPMVDNQDAWDRIAGHKGASPDVYDNRNRGGGGLGGRTFNDPEDIANAVLYLNSDRASRVTGISLSVDGGAMLVPPENPGGGPGHSTEQA